MQQRKNALVHLCATWEKSLHDIPGNVPLSRWGPSEEELKSVLSTIQDVTVMVEAEEEDIEIEYQSGEEEYEDDLDAGFVDQLDALDLADSTTVEEEVE